MAAYLRSLRGLSSTQPLNNQAPVWVASTHRVSSPVRSSNVLPNLWLSSQRRPLTRNLWLGGLGQHATLVPKTTMSESPLAPRPKHPNLLRRPLTPFRLVSTSMPTYTNMKLDRLASSFGLSRPSHFNSSKSGQRSRYSGAPYAIGFSTNTTLGFEDFGFSNGSAAKEFQLRLSSFSARSLARSLCQTGAPSAVKGVNSAFFLGHFGDRAASLLRAHAELTEYSRMPTRRLGFTS